MDIAFVLLVILLCDLRKDCVKKHDYYFELYFICIAHSNDCISNFSHSSYIIASIELLYDKYVSGLEVKG